MIVYLDTSAVLPVLIAGASTVTCRRVWSDADRRTSSRRTYVEVAAALAMAQRRGRISTPERDRAWTSFGQIWPDIDIVDVTPELSSDAAGFARDLALRGYDSVHCASAALVNDPDVVAASGDAQLLAAWRAVGIAVLDTTAG